MATYAKIPASYETINLYNAGLRPSSIHTKNTGLYNYYYNRLFIKALSVLEWKNIPETWSLEFFKQVLFGFGFLTVFKTDKYGVIPQNCTLSDTHTIFYQPKRVIVANPVLPSSLELEVGKDCELLRLQPDYKGITEIVSFYADMLAVASETAAVNLLNSRASFVFFAQNKAAAETYKKMYDTLASGDPFAVIDKNLLNEDGSHNWEWMQQNVGQNYIVTDVLNDLKTIEDRYNTKIGIPNANTQKRERLITSEVEANDADTQCLVDVWLDTLNRDLEKINARYGLNISVSYRYKPKEVSDDNEVNAVDTGAL